MRLNTLDREIFALALPALGALIAPPLFVIIDSAMVGHLGTNELAGLSVATTVSLTIVGTFIFLAYTTTSMVARRLGAGDQHGAIRSGIDGIWLAIVLGVIAALVLIGTSGQIVAALGARSAVAHQAQTYLQFCAPGMIGMFVVLSGNGALRGLLDTKTPLLVASGGAVANTIFNAIFIYGLNLGIAGSALGTALAQTLMGLALGVKVKAEAAKYGVSFRPALAGIGEAFMDGIPLLIRTLALRGAIVATVVVTTSLGVVVLAGSQIINSILMLAAFIIDALAIAAQALIGHAVGAGDSERIRAITRRTLGWGTVFGATVAMLIIVSAPFSPHLFTSDPQVLAAVTICLIVTALGQPLAAWVYVLDGILIGAGASKLLAVGMVTALVVYLPVVVVLYARGPHGNLDLTWVWLAYLLAFSVPRAMVSIWGMRRPPLFVEPAQK